jgi:hypothetical protein
MRIALAASMHASLAPNAPIRVDKEIMFRRKGHNGSFRNSRPQAIQTKTQYGREKVQFLFSVRVARPSRRSPAVDPRDFKVQFFAKVFCGGVHADSMNGGP